MIMFVDAIFSNSVGVEIPTVVYNMADTTQTLWRKVGTANNFLALMMSSGTLKSFGRIPIQTIVDGSSTVSDIFGINAAVEEK